MASDLLTCTSRVSSYYENPPKGISYSYYTKLMYTGPLTVMADSNILSNVDKSLVESVVETSTTDADANTNPTSIAAPSGILNNNKALAHKHDNKTSIGTSSLGVDDGVTVGVDSDAIGHMNGINSTDSGLKLDTESICAPNSRPGSVSPTKADGSRLLDRKSSLKKPTFKPVSLNKAFLKEQTSSSGPTPSPLSSTIASTKAFSHQPAPRGPTVSKLKLVRTGGTSQSSRPGGTGSSLSTGLKRNEQAQPVWNKNQPIPPPPTKDVTDEELKKEYGIHMASRLGPEGTGAKWADIDDDDDDWVPEVPEKWGDALKLAPVEPTPPVIAPSPTPPAKVEQAPLEVVDTSPPKTPLPATTKEEVRPKTLITERLSSKPIEKAPPPTIRASPWAKVPPAPVQSLGSNMSQSRDMEPPRRPNYGTESVTNHSSGQPHGMKEVSADVYGRSWRDGNHNQGPRERELYNSETGQLEPVQESRNKGPRARTEGNADKPSVLQRPTGPPPPAEPSPAFQQQRSSMMHHRPEEYRRRRTSSNVSGGSGSTGRRPSFSKFGLEQPLTPEDGRFPPRPGPLSHSSTDAYQDHHNHAGPPVAKFETSSQVSNIEGPSPIAAPIQPVIPETPIEDLVAQQERIMKEGRELARKRRQEAEEKEEAAKKERLRVKLEELEKKALEKQEAENRAAEEARLAQEKVEADRKAEEERIIAEKKAAEEEAARKAAEARLVSDRYEHPRSNPPTQPHGRRSLNTMQNRSPNKSFAMPTIRDSKDQPWKHVPPGNDRYTSWGGTQQNSQGSGPNPWGPIEKPRFQGVNGVGNGTFDNRYSGFSTRPPPPTGAYPQNARDDRRNSRGPPTSPGLPRGGLSQEERASAVNRWNALPGKILEDEAEQGRKNREAYLARQAEEEATGLKKPDIAPPKLVEKWRKVDEDDVGSKFVGQSETPQGGEESSSTEELPGALLATTVGTSADSTKVASNHPVVPAPNVPSGLAATRPASRFFPAAAGDLIAQHLGTQPKSSQPLTKELSPPGSPPPPMSAEHPVHGDINSRVVQLPPSSHPHYQHPHGRVSPTLHMNGHHRMSHPKSPQFSVVQAFEAVQQKILGMTQKHSPSQQTAHLQVQPPKGPASKDFSSTKPLYDESPEGVVSRSATVSLPPQSDSDEGSTSGGSDVREESILTKPDNEEFFHELFERDFGSTPTVKLPHVLPAIYANHAKKVNLPKAYKRPLPRWQLQTTDIFHPFGNKDFINGDGKKFIPVHLPGGASIEVLSRDGKRNTGNKKGYTQQRPKNNRYSGGGNTSGGSHTGRGGAGGMGRRVAEPVQ